MLSLRSCPSIVLQRFFSLVSGKMIAKNPHNNIVNPTIPKDRNSFLLPVEVNIGANTEPNAKPCLASDVVKFLTLVGYNSIVNIINTLYAKHEQKKDASSSQICMPSLPLPITTHYTAYATYYTKGKQWDFTFPPCYKEQG